MNVEILRKLHALTSPLTMDNDDWFKLLNGWSNYFHMHNIRPEQQVAEFNRIILARVKKYRITVCPPDDLDS